MRRELSRMTYTDMLPHPHLVIFDDQYEDIHLYADQTVIFKNCDMIEGISAMIAMFFSGGVQYPHEARDALELFQRYFCDFLRLEPASKQSKKLMKWSTKYITILRKFSGSLVQPKRFGNVQ